MQYSRNKYIEIRHHFTRDHVQNSDILLKFISTDKQLVDIFIKFLSEDRFCMIKIELEVCDPFA